MNKLVHFPYQHVLVLGLAKSGTAAANILLDNNVNVRVNDDRTKDDAEIVKELREKGAEVIVGSHPLSILENIDVIIKNPGIPYENVIVKEAITKDIPILTEIELAQLLASRNEIIGITGSNGKTTTTTLVSDMLKCSEQQVQLAGNIGVVACEVAQHLQTNEKLLLELSSFQLLGIQSFKPHIAVLLNLYEAHLDYHGTIENYVQAKMNLFQNQNRTDFLVYNADDKKVREVVQHAKSTLVPFSVTSKQLNGAWIHDEVIYFKEKKIISLDEIVLVGAHNLENILAAVCVAMLTNTNETAIRYVLQHFKGVKHRLQFVDKVNGRLFYNDSKATNVLATQKALQSFRKPTILLAGGLDRGNSFDPLLPYLKNVKAMVTFGETAAKLAKLANKAEISEVRQVADVKEATREAYKLSDDGDIILLSPACASWDQYKTFEERGDMFVHAVHILA